MPSIESEQRGLAYLYQMRALAPEPELIDLVYQLELRRSICVWMGQHIETVNAQVADLGRACQACFHPWQQRSIALFAVPLSHRLGLDGVCNLQTHPVTILVDVGRVMPADWLALVAHEYAHAHLGVPGHPREFVEVLAHLARGLNLRLPPLSAPPACWPAAPAYARTPDPHAFWQGRAHSPPRSH
ncbi:hypothetical protein HJG54_34195 [Leptolyngbya sp. NK1-12]|uniref:Uncharacterized protein n=2 Tax=Leptolyngbya sp. NK1-12 TaxID=2547451 RepID=A0AA97AIP6_9CYAN|nr:hypothetical protein HJG54_28705 [Leptolyngbya sp. NK1-12]WNZ27877.1 hypothetical protein HJG54_34195 [Leptolyngbya sp. NK1-12]